MKLNQIVKITATLKCLSGLHIGGSESEMHIGGIDNCVVKHPLTQRPYIPGSSIKGKMRSLLEWKSGAVREKPLDWSDYDKEKNVEVLRILQLFGSAASEKSDEAIEAIGPTRLSFWDCSLTPEYEDMVLESNALFTEAKTENVINRISGLAEHPRQVERVPANATFNFTLTMKQLDGDDKVLLETVLKGLKLLELDSLGGSGSRGYGKVCFENLKINGQECNDFYNLDPFKG